MNGMACVFLALCLQTRPPDAPTPTPDAMQNAALADNTLRRPVLVYSVDPEFPEQARQQHIRGNIQVSLVVDASGIPQEVKVVRGLA